MQEKAINPKSAAVWENRWVRFRMALTVAGVEPRVHDFCPGWVLGFLGFIKPAKFTQAGIGQVEGYLQKLAGEGKENWQVRQAEEALRVFYREVEPALWARSTRVNCCVFDLWKSVKSADDGPNPAIRDVKLFFVARADRVCISERS